MEQVINQGMQLHQAKMLAKLNYAYFKHCNMSSTFEDIVDELNAWRIKIMQQLEEIVPAQVKELLERMEQERVGDMVREFAYGWFLEIEKLTKEARRTGEDLEMPDISEEQETINILWAMVKCARAEDQKIFQMSEI
ncbi:hypothetical protein VFPPC_06588 [Pochonia chlamydosporia 170]|uniref:Uncharacterized protein n=1 Tax=Pochonia chlamydosporia 170 TaxID=1380566 RepID=A0A179F4U0_METCM|nr:hypothetical protein VFPPC_06588 [Pochonia chlamydosporia 170]OAQ60448.1 hypothetical protein VFPPC_06588 [Pochonia chlamydosporia 170]